MIKKIIKLTLCTLVLSFLEQLKILKKNYFFNVKSIVENNLKRYLF